MLSTHILSDVERICDKIGLLIDGRIEIEGNLNEVMERYSKPILCVECTEVEKLKTFVKNLDGCRAVYDIAGGIEIEIDADKLDNEFFKKGERRYNRYINELKKIGIEESNITVCNCYSDSKSRAWTGSQNACSLPSGCSSKTCKSCSLPACNYVAYSNNAGTGDGTIKSGCSSNNESCNQTVASVKASAGHRVSGTSCPACAVGTFQGSNDSTATSCSVCAANTYAPSTGMSSCTSCPSGYVTSGTAAANHDAKSDCTISCQAGQRVTQADAQCSTPSGSWYTAAHTVAAGSTTPSSTVKACLTNYATPNTTTRTDHDALTDCRISCAAGTRIASANATSCTTPAGNWYVGAHSVAQGSTSSVSSCLTNYTISGTAASNHDAANDCKISCGGGSYIAKANATSCSAGGAGYWAAASTISQGSAGVRNQCDAGLTTIGSGAGADEEDDCGRVLNFNGEKIYLRSGKKTTPSLNVGINGTTFYGNLGTGSVGSLRIKSGNTTYSVYDDSMQ